MIVKEIGPIVWKTLAESAHLGVFGEFRDKDKDRIDFALLAINEQDIPVGYMTCREMDADKVYWQYGGMFEPFRNTIASWKVYEAFRDWHKEKYQAAYTRIENDNIAMLKMAWKIGFRIIGTRYYNGVVLIEHELKFGEKNEN